MPSTVHYVSASLPVTFVIDSTNLFFVEELKYHVGPVANHSLDQFFHLSINQSTCRQTNQDIDQPSNASLVC
jgi:hypothetical protein